MMRHQFWVGALPARGTLKWHQSHSACLTPLGRMIHSFLVDSLLCFVRNFFCWERQIFANFSTTPSHIFHSWSPERLTDSKLVALLAYSGVDKGTVRQGKLNFAFLRLCQDPATFQHYCLPKTFGMTEMENPGSLRQTAYFCRAQSLRLSSFTSVI